MARTGRRRWARLLACAAVATGLALAWMSPAVHAQDITGSDPVTYTVVPGDTLFEIAQSFGVPLENLVAANSIGNVDMLEIGQVLVIPAPVVQPETGEPDGNFYANALPGESLVSFAARIGQDATAIAALNSLPETARLFPGQPLRVPVAYDSPEPRSFGAVLSVTVPDSLAQGRTGHVIVETKRPLDLSADWNGLPIAFTPLGDNPLRQFAFLPVPALLEPVDYPLTISYSTANGVSLARAWSIGVVDGDYERQELTIPSDRSDLLASETVQAELARVIAVWSQVSPTLSWTEPFSRPIDLAYDTTSPFGTRRSYNGGPYSGYHEGQDFGAPAGVTVTVPADGIVALSEPLNVRGNAVILDHGRGVFTGYWHLEETPLQAGQAVSAGDFLGLVGNTGLSTGAHLHWELRIYGIAVNPMQFLEEPFSP